MCVLWVCVALYLLGADLGNSTSHRTATIMVPLLLTSGSVRYEAVLHSCGTSPLGRWVPTCDSAISGQLYSTASLEHQATDSMTCYPTESHYPDTEPTNPCHILIMLSAMLEAASIIKGIGLKTVRSGLKPATFRFPDLLEREAAALLMCAPRMVAYVCMWGFLSLYSCLMHS